MKDPSEESMGHLGSHPGAALPRGTRRSLGKERPSPDGRANPRAATRVNPEQASKRTLRTPTRSEDGAGRRALDSSTPMQESCAVRRGSGSGEWRRTCVQRGRPTRAGVSAPRRALARGARPARESEGSTVPTRPGNAGGGKGPCFWDACEGAKDRGLA
jgi:hypothetical protein